MKWKTKKTTWVFLYIKYSKFWSVSLEHFVECKPLISEEWKPEYNPTPSLIVLIDQLCLPSWSNSWWCFCWCCAAAVYRCRHVLYSHAAAWYTRTLLLISKLLQIIYVYMLYIFHAVLSSIGCTQWSKFIGNMISAHRSIRNWPPISF